MKYSLEPCFRLYDDSNGCLIEVRVDSDFPDLINIYTPNKDSIDYYGNICFTINKDQASLLIKALTKQIELMNEFEENN